MPRPPSLPALLSLASLAALALMAVHCGGGSESTGGGVADASVDAGSDVALDSAVEGGADVGADTSSDVASEASADVAADAAPEASSDAKSDAATDTAADAPFTPPKLYDALKGYVWVFGMLPGFKHVTYVRFDTPDGRNGAAYYHNRTIDKYSGYFAWPSECGNIGLFSADETTREVVLQLPGGCSADAGLSSVTITFDKFLPGDGVPAPRAKLETGVSESTGGSIEAYAFPLDFCDKTMTTCEDALK